MDNLKRYHGVIAFCVLVVGIFVLTITRLVIPKIEEQKSLTSTVESKQEILEKKQKERDIIQAKIKKIKDSISTSQKKIYYPIESSLGNDTLFFTLYNDVIEMLHANSIKIKSIDYEYNPQQDNFVKFDKNDSYFVCDINMEIVSNYVNLGKFIQDVYQYPYYIKINDIEVKPYPKDKKILLSAISLRLYAHTAPEDIPAENEQAGSNAGEALKGADIPLPQ